MRNILAVMATALLLSVAGCEQEQAEQPAKPEPAAEQPKASTTAPTQDKAAKPKAEAAKPKAAQPAKDTETVTNEACLAAARKETGEPDIEVTSNEFSEANTLVMLGVGAQRAPWRCLVSNRGEVAELSFEGNDGDGVATGTSDQDTETVTNEACLAAARDETGEPDIEVTSNEFSEANTLVMLGVGAQRAPWRCLVSNRGEVAELLFEGNDGDGVDEEQAQQSGLPAAGSASDLSEFEGARAGQAEMGIQKLGFEAVRTEGLTTYWLNRETNACAEIVTSDGRYSSVKMLPGDQCAQ